MRAIECLLLSRNLAAIVSLLAAGSLPAALIQAAPNAQTISVTCDFEEPRTQRIGEAARVAVDGCEILQRVGAPLMPFRTMRVLLPPAGRVEALVARSLSGERALPGAWRIGHGRLPVQQTGGDQVAGEADPEIYLSANPYPATRVELASVQTMSGFSVAFLRVFPLQYLPLKGELVLAQKVEIELTVAVGRAGLQEVAQPPRRVQRQVAERLRNTLVNPSMLQAYEGRAVASMSAPADEFDYLLITRSNLAAGFAPLVTLKAGQGLAVKVETTEAITGAEEGQDVPEKIRNYIRKAHNNWGVTYVLLGGDTAVVPCRYAYVSMGSLVSNPILPSDLYYGCLDGSWNRDNDSRWGESNDGEDGGDVDLLADVRVGRAPVETEKEVAAFVEKTVRYSTQAHPNASKVQVIAEFLRNFPTGPAQGGDMFDPLVPVFRDYEISWLDDRPLTTPQWSREDALEALNRSPHLALFNGHGNDDTLIGAEHFLTRAIETAHLDSLTNAWPFLACSVGCNVGQFDNDRFWPDCIGEELIKRNHHGAFAAILNSRLGWFDPEDPAKYSGEFQTRFFERLIEQGQSQLGMAAQECKHDLVSQVEPSGIMTYRWCYYEISLLGDPHLTWQTPSSPQTDHWFTVLSQFGAAAPSPGKHRIRGGTPVTCQVVGSPAPGERGVRYVCRGWRGTGSVPSLGSGLQMTFTITNDSQLSWEWAPQYQLEADSDPNGTVIFSDEWFESGALASVTAMPAPYYHFERWSGDVPASETSSPKLELTIDRPHTLRAAFAPNVTSQGTPEWWLAAYGATNEFESVAMADTDRDGMLAWQEYVAGTSPVYALSVLRIALQTESGSAAVLSWPGVAGRSYSVFKLKDLRGGGLTVLANSLLATPPWNTFRDSSTSSGSGFYRVEAHFEPLK
ncbi:MAG: C25 family cysteine peptidase [Verrucomicrobiia bacterium]